jgi:opacity protein-like surface antigen
MGHVGKFAHGGSGTRSLREPGISGDARGPCPRQSIHDRPVRRCQRRHQLEAGALVLGVEGDINWSNIDGTGSCSGLFSFLGGGQLQAGCNTKMPWFATATARIGTTVDHALAYVKGGGAWAEFDHTITTGAAGFPVGVSGPTYDLADNRIGFTVGAGIEYALGRNWSAKIEYDYMDLGTKSLALTPTTLGIIAPLAIGINVDDRERVQLIKAGSITDSIGVATRSSRDTKAHVRFNASGNAPSAERPTSLFRRKGHGVPRGLYPVRRLVNW